MPSPAPEAPTPPAKAPKLAKKRGRKPATGPFATRAEFCTEVRWYYDNTTMSVEAIGHRFGVSQGAANKALNEALGLHQKETPPVLRTEGAERLAEGQAQ